VKDAEWVRRTDTDTHRCPTPADSGSIGDLWRCPDCRVLLRVASACDLCDIYGYGRHGGQHMAGVTWRSATVTQQLLTWLRGRR
jgi:hypothetical protein